MGNGDVKYISKVSKICLPINEIPLMNNSGASSMLAQEREFYRVAIISSTPTEQVVKDGANGGNGKNGDALKRADHHQDDDPGNDGENGKNGENGENGKHGAHANSVYIKLECADLDVSMMSSSEKLVLEVSGSVEKFAMPVERVSSKVGKLWINAKGGDGVRGGNGGKGGDGGKGQDGHKGRDSFPPTKGADGGSGGRGGDGGKGGNGGNGGNGGLVIIETNNSKLLMLVEVDVRGGKAGEPGKGGAAGKGGAGGFGGKGGKSDNPKEVAINGTNGALGVIGKDGKDGGNGADGYSGNVFYVVNYNNERIEQGNKRYNAKVTGFTIKGCVDDNVYEPGEEIFIEKVEITNDGNLTLPAGCLLTLKRTETIIPMEDCVFKLPEIKPNGNIVVDCKLRAKIAENSKPVTARFKGIADVCTCITLLDCSFEDSLFQKQIPIQYPIRIERMIHRSVLGPSDIDCFRLEISNISKLAYGEKQQQAAAISYKITFDSDLHLVEKENQSYLEGTVYEIAALNTATVLVKVRLSNSAIFFRRLKWRADLYFRGKFIETMEREVRVCPHYDPVVSKSDFLFITNPSISELEFEMYKKIFNILALKPNYYDTEMYQNPSQEDTSNDSNHADSQSQQPNHIIYNDSVVSAKPASSDYEWFDKYHGKPILFPLGSSSTKCIKGSHILSHMVSKSAVDKSDSLDSGLVIVGVKSVPKYTEVLLNELYTHTSTKKDLTEEEFSDTFYVNTPTKEYMQQKMKKIVETKTVEGPSQLYRVFCSEYEPRKLGWTSYTYGKAYLKQLPVNRTHRILFVPFAPDDMEASVVEPAVLQQQQQQQLQGSQVQQAPQVSPHCYLKQVKEADLTPIVKAEGPFFEVLISLLSSLSIEKKLGYFVNANKFSSVKFSRQQKEYSLLDLVRTALYEDLKREFFYKDQGLSRAQRVIDYVKANKQSFMNEEAVYSVWLVVTRLVSHTYWRSLKFLSDLNQKRDKLIEMQDKLGKELDDKITVASKPIKEIKQRAATDAEDANRLKLQDLMKLSVFPFYGE